MTKYFAKANSYHAKLSVKAKDSLHKVPWYIVMKNKCNCKGKGLQSGLNSIGHYFCEELGSEHRHCVVAPPPLNKFQVDHLKTSQTEVQIIIIITW